MKIFLSKKFFTALLVAFTLVENTQNKTAQASVPPVSLSKEDLNKKVRVFIDDGTTLTGKLKSFNPQEIKIYRNSVTKDIPTDKIKKIKVLHRKQRKQSKNFFFYMKEVYFNIFNATKDERITEEPADYSVPYIIKKDQESD